MSIEGSPTRESGGSSPLSSLGSSPESAARPSKRPRLSSSRPSPPPLFLAQHRSPPSDTIEYHPAEDFTALLEGLDEREFALPPSSDPLARRQDDSDVDEQLDGDDSTVTVHGKERGREAYNSGIVLLPRDVHSVRVEAQEEEQERETRVKSVEPPDKVVVEQDDEEFEGDDMWLGFDDADMGFDQPDAFPGPISSLARASIKSPEREEVNDIKADGRDTPDGRTRGEKEEEEEVDEMYSKPVDLAAFGFSSVASGAGGFVFATRKNNLPTADALARAKQLLDNDDAFSESATTSERPRRLQLPPARVRMIARQDPVSAAPTSVNGPLSLGFQNAAGRSIALPDQGALDRARGAYDRATSPPTRSSAAKSKQASNNPSRASLRAGRPGFDLFGAGAENRESESFSLHAAPLADKDLPPSPNSFANTFDSPTISRTRSFLQASDLDERTTYDGRRSPLAPVENLVPHSEDMRSDNGSATDPASSSPRKPEPSPLPPDHVRAPLSSSSANESASAAFPRPIPSPNLTTATATSSAKPPDDPIVDSTPIAPRRLNVFRPPMLDSAHHGPQPRSSTPLRSSLRSTVINPLPIVSSSASGTPLFNRRLNIGMTPRNKPFHLANTQSSSSGRNMGKSSFVSPFKNGKRPEGLTPTGLKSMSAATPTSETSNLKPAASVKIRTRVSQLNGTSTRDHRTKIFDLDLEQTRFNLLDYGMRPQTHLFEELENQGLSEELLSMNSTSASTFVFPCGRSVRDAFRTLKALVAGRLTGEEALVTAPWVENHWSLIVWKLASYVRTRPDLLEKWWTFEMVMDQLRYRYEREINRAERSAVKRIQERDSSAALPLVLCVSQLLWDDPEDGLDESEGLNQIIVGIELTDGWYRIRAVIDPTLRSACERGKLIIGSKLAITGARLDKVKSDGIDVLEALDASRLLISGNSTSLAPWHATLGFSGTPFFASLDSLSSKGGVVAPLDIIVVKIFELGYVDATRANAGTWGEAEEREKAEEWERGRRRIHNRMADAAERDGTDEDDLVALLQDAVQGAGEDALPSKGEEEPEVEDPDEVIDQLERAKSKRAFLRNFSLPSLQACLTSALERASRSLTESYSNLQQELDQKYPPRQIRSVRMMRIKDAREGVNGPFDREAILTVWDVKDYASDFFREGKRYHVTNTIVKGNWQRKTREITLHTRKESKWRKVEPR